MTAPIGVCAISAARSGGSRGVKSIAAIRCGGIAMIARSAVTAPRSWRGRAAIAAEMLGGVQETFERTVDYLKQREQFGTKIGTFQALQHRAAHMFSEIELLKSVVLDACANVDANPALLPLSASLAKAKANDTFELVSNEAVQMHGGIGTTDELDIGLFLKRSRVAMQILGDARFHRARYATLRGF